MKIGILTFHWGTNYGGVLQAFALQTTLQKMGYNVEIINYAPISHRDSFWRCLRSRHVSVISKQVIEYIKEKKFKQFRTTNLILTQRLYTQIDVENIVNNYDVLISGSDQVWNPYIIDTYGWPYFLPFKGNFKKISYAVSLGCIDYPNKQMIKVLSFIKDFNHISVREQTAINIIQNSGIHKNIELMPDPTLLLEEVDLLNLIKKEKSKKNSYVFSYILQKNQKLIKLINEYLINESWVIFDSYSKFKPLSIPQWIGAIKEAQFIVTNSFHGVVFSILFRKDFLAIPMEGQHSEMNDRIITLLDQFNLSNRIVYKFDELIIDELIKSKIDWTNVDLKRKKLKVIGIDYLMKTINEQ